MRKIKNSALELLHTDKTILEIAYGYGFSNPETYTRAFSKIVGITPSEFRRLRPLVGKEELIAGVYGIGLLNQKEQRSDMTMNREVFSTKEILANAMKALTGRIDCGYSKGILAYDAWKKALEVERDFSVDGNYSLLFEKALCQMDAFGCLIDGRKAAAAYFTELAEKSSKMNIEACGTYRKIAEAFTKCVETVREMRSLYSSPNGFDGFMEKLADTEVRRKTCGLIEVAKKADYEALELIKIVSEQISR